MFTVLVIALVGSALAAPEAPIFVRKLVPFTPFTPGGISRSVSFAPVPVLPPVTSFAPVPVLPPVTSFAPVPVLPAVTPFVPVRTSVPFSSGGFKTLVNDDGRSAPVVAVFPGQKPSIVTTSRVHLADESGKFLSDFTDSAGTRFQEEGRLVPTNDGQDQVLIKSGTYSYTDPDGKRHSVSFSADARGFHPVSADIPIPVHPIH